MGEGCNSRPKSNNLPILLWVNQVGHRISNDLHYICFCAIYRLNRQSGNIIINIFEISNPNIYPRKLTLIMIIRIIIIKKKSGGEGMQWDGVLLVIYMQTPSVILSPLSRAMPCSFFSFTSLLHSCLCLPCLALSLSLSSWPPSAGATARLATGGLPPQLWTCLHLLGFSFSRSHGTRSVTLFPSSVSTGLGHQWTGWFKPTSTATTSTWRPGGALPRHRRALLGHRRLSRNCPVHLPVSLL